MKLHIDVEQKTVAIEGTCKIATVFNYLMSWFPETWDEWSFIPYSKTIKYKEIIVEKTVYKNPYWNPWNTPYYLSSTLLESGDNLINGIVSNTYTATTDSKLTLNFNTI